MSDILISIRPKYVDKILAHEKRFEFRTKVCKRKIEKLYIYSSYPVCKVVGCALVSDIISDTPQNLWNRTSEYAGISNADFFAYFKGRCTAFAYALDKVEIFDFPKTLADFGLKRPPQNFLYLTSDYEIAVAAWEEYEKSGFKSTSAASVFEKAGV